MSQLGIPSIRNDEPAPQLRRPARPRPTDPNAVQPRILRILNLGAGVQSTTVLRMSIHGELPQLDASIFADTWWEPKAVYEHLKLLKAETIAAGIPLHIVTAGDLRQHVLDGVAAGKRVSSPPFFTIGDKGDSVIINRSCTGDFKIDPIERKVKELIGHKPYTRLPTEVRAEQWLGISGDEIERMKVSMEPWVRFWHPLIEMPWTENGSHTPMRDRSLTREDCQRWLVAHGYPEAPRSACVGCPFRSNAEWRDLRDNDPEAWENACQFDDAIRGVQSHKLLHGMKRPCYLHRSLKPLRIAPIDENDAGQVRFECTGVCRN